MNSDTLTILSVCSAIALALFLGWALLPAMRAHRDRILRSPATWALVILAGSILWLKWEERKIAVDGGSQTVYQYDC